MATYLELRTIVDNNELRNRIQVAVMVAVDTIRQENPATENHANRMIWAASAIASPKSAADACLRIAIAQNKDYTVAQIIGADDVTLQAAVDSAINLLAGE